MTGALLAVAVVAVGWLALCRGGGRRGGVVATGVAVDARPAALEPARPRGTLRPAAAAEPALGERTVPPPRRSRLRQVAGAVVTVLALGAFGFWCVAMRPLSLGGPANYTVIHGNSMWPLYKDGDLIITQRKAGYATGDVVAYTVPRGEIGAGHLVIHRIIGGSTSRGLNLKGDHNPDVDPWHPRLADVAGSTWLQVPRAGKLLVLLHQPLPLAGIAMLVTVVAVLRRKPRPNPATVTEAAAQKPG